MFVRDDTNGGVLGGAEEYDSIGIGASDGDASGVSAETTGQTAHQPLLAETDETEVQIEEEGRRKQRKFTLFTEIEACLSSPVLVTLSLGWA